jgi:hypothetical protein
MFSNVLGVVAAVCVFAALVLIAERSDFWPRSACATSAPYGPHDYRCKFFVGR